MHSSRLCDQRLRYLTYLLEMGPVAQIDAADDMFSHTARVSWAGHSIFTRGPYDYSETIRP